MIVCISKALVEQYPKVAYEFTYYLKRNNIPLKVIDSTNIWVRDTMPIQTAGGYTKFVYEKDDRFPQLEVKR